MCWISDTLLLIRSSDCKLILRSLCQSTCFQNPIGQCCVDIANMDEEVLDEIDRRVEEFIPAARALLPEKTNSAAVFAQKKLNAVWDIVFTMPVYRDLNMDLELSYHLLERLYEQKDKWTQVQDVHSDGHEIYERMAENIQGGDSPEEK